LHRLANPPKVSGFLFSRLPTIARCCVRVRVKGSPKFVEELRELSVAGSFVNERWQALEGLPNR